MNLTTVKVLLIANLVACAPIATFQGSDKVMVLAKANDKCEKVNSFKQWTLLWGSMPFRQLRLDQYGSDVSYKIVMKHTLSDKLITYFGGFMFSLGRKTVEMQRCSSEFLVYDKKDEAKKSQAEKLRALAVYAKETEGTEATDLPMMLLTNDKIVQGRIIELSPDSVMIETVQQIPITPEINDADWIYKKDGEIIFCKISRTTGEAVEYTIAGKAQKIVIKEISKIQFEKKRKEQESIEGQPKYIEKTSRKTYPMNDVSRIELHPQKESQDLRKEIEDYLQKEKPEAAKSAEAGI